jgi:hypothetical protein
MTSIVKKSPGSLSKRDPLAFSDHGSFHGTVLRAMAGGAGSVFLAYLLDWLLQFGLVDSWLFPIVVATGALAAVGSRGKNVLKAMIGGAFGALGGGLFALTAGQWAPFGALLLGAAAAPVLGEGDSMKRKAVTAALTGALGFAGLYVGKVLLALPILSALVPEPLGAAVAGAAAGLFFGLGAAPKHLARPMDPVEAKYLAALDVKDGELYEILHRALTIQRAVKLDLEGRADDDTVKRLGARITELMLRILQIAEQCRTIESDLSAAPAYELEERIGQLQSKAEASADPSARRTYESAIASLDEQRRALQEIGRGRERVIAKLHANVALLEKVRFSLLHLRSAVTERVGGESSPVAEALEELGREIDATSSAVSEVWGQTGDLLPPPKKDERDPDNVVALPEKSTVESDAG